MTRSTDAARSDGASPAPAASGAVADACGASAGAPLASLLEARRRSLPAAARTPTQLAGVGGIACGATRGVMERCNFACTSCYLTDLANRARPLPFDEVSRQLQALREHLGPGGKVQITSGEVTLLDVDALGRIVAHARELELDPMVMTNGERFLREPDYLLRLVREFGLRKVSFHIDVTQRGRPGWRAGMREHELRGLRRDFAALVRRVRRETGVHLHAAQTVTVTPENLDDVPEVVEEGLANADAFRILSFLPSASVGRTEDAKGPATLAELWERITQPFGRVLNRHAMHFGHPECNVTVPVVVVQRGEARRVVELVRAGSRRDERGFAAALGAASTAIDLDDGPLRNAARGLVALARRPRAAGAVAAWLLARAWGERAVARSVVAGWLRRERVRVVPLLFVVHRFMDAEELATPLGRERLDACVFKVPVDGELVSMCELNATPLRRDLDAQRVGAGSAAG